MFLFDKNQASFETRFDMWPTKMTIFTWMTWITASLKMYHVTFLPGYHIVTEKVDKEFSLPI